MSSRALTRILAVGVCLFAAGARPGSGESAEPPKCSWPASLDAVAAAPANHKILFENEQVRVLDVVVPPGTRQPTHAHCWPSVLYLMKDSVYVDYDQAGNVLFDSRKAGPAPPLPMVEWMGPQAPHAVENLGDVAIHLVRVELKK
jgi:hypothetical protein